MKIQFIKIWGIQQKQPLRGRFIPLNSCIRIEGSKIRNLSFHLWKLKQRREAQSEQKKRNSTIKAEISKIEIRKPIEKKQVLWKGQYNLINL